LTTKYFIKNYFMARNRTHAHLPSGASAAGSVSDCSLAILRSLRRILRRVELASFELESNFGITAPQLLCLRALVNQGPMIQNELSKAVHLSASTLVGVLDRLEAKGFVTRTRDHIDRRRIHVEATTLGEHRERHAPEPLQGHLERQLGELSDHEQSAIARSLEHLVILLEAQHIEAPPVLASGPIPKPPDLEGREV
jgi:DNA-binding MarR family transcriptional regulator